jgi:transposase
MRYELCDYEWGIIKLTLPNKPRGIPVLRPTYSQRHILGQRVATRYDKLAAN